MTCTRCLAAKSAAKGISGTEMTPTDYEHWKDFAFRMAKLPSKTPPTKWVVEMVAWWFNTHDHPKYDIEDVNSWDQGPTYVCDNVSAFLGERFDGRGKNCGYGFDAYERAYDRWMNTWGNAVSCCIRAGLDLVALPSMGVLGFSIGDLRKMYPEGFPEWLEKVLKEFVDSDKKKPVNLKTLKDSAQLWL